MPKFRSTVSSVLSAMMLFTIALNAISCRHDAPGSMQRAAATQPVDPVLARIRDEGLNRSKVMDTLDYLCNDIGPRLTGSPQCKRANDWTRNTLAAWGLTNAHLEAWGPFGRGWQVKRFSIQVVEPGTIILHGYPKAWSPGFEEPVEAPVVYLDAKDSDGLEKFKGELKGAIVMIGATRELSPRFDAMASRMSDADLAKLTGAQPGSSALLGQPRDQTASERRAQFEASGATGNALVNRRRAQGNGQRAPTTSPATRPASQPSGRRGFDPFQSRAMEFAQRQGAILILTPSTRGDGGTVFVQQALIPGDSPRRGGEATTGPSTSATAPSTTAPTTRPRVWSTSAPTIPPQITLATEDYNRVARMIQRGEKLKIACDLRVEFKTDDPMGYNTIAEIPGSDLKDQIVMVGAHLDSWHSGTGATDNAVGSAAAMEAARIIRALNLQPRRTIRVALWTGEEQGIFGSEAYVKEHFGYDPNPRGQRPRPIGDDAHNAADATAASQPAPPAKQLITHPEYEKLSAYFNLDNGTGKIRGIYAQNNVAAAQIFRQWIKPFNTLGVTTVTISNTGSTDHVSFDTVGLPGFQFIQDPIEYSSRTHHSNMDVYDRIQADDIKQASTVMAAFVWNAANMDQRFPRKPLDAGTIVTTAPPAQR